MSVPRVGFLGTGWIGRHRMEAMISTGAVEPVALCDPSPDAVAQALAAAPDAQVVALPEAMFELGLDGIVIATPSALHAEQAIAALERGVAVFCQKPLGRDEAEVRAVVAAAEKADRLLGVDLSYRRTAATEAMVEQLREGALGGVFAADLTFHNAYGPDKDWFYDRDQSGGGCVIDLGVHLVDLALWLLDFPEVQRVSSRLYSRGRLIEPGSSAVEDYATAQIDLATGASLRLACSWNLHAGQDALVEAQFHGTNGAVEFRNVDGSFFDFKATLNRGTTQQELAAPPDDWGGRVAGDWARQLEVSPGFDPDAWQLVDVAKVLDRIYRGE